MIKRRFYRFEHGDKDAPSESSSSSDSEGDVEAIDETEVEEEEVEEEEEEVQEEDGDVISNQRQKEETSSSGYESEDSSANEVTLDSSGLPASDDDVVSEHGGTIDGNLTIRKSNKHNLDKDESPFDVNDCVLKIKSVFKCRLCPRIVCLSEETLKAHLNSKRHARSEKLHKEGRLKLTLNSEGQIEGEMDPDDHDDTAVAEIPSKPKKKGEGRWKQRKRSKQEAGLGKPRHSRGKRGKRQR